MSVNTQSLLFKYVICSTENNYIKVDIIRLFGTEWSLTNNNILRLINIERKAVTTNIVSTISTEFTDNNYSFAF